MKLFNTTAAMLMLVMSALLGNSALAQTTPVANCSVLYTNASAAVGSVCVTVNPLTANVFVDYTLIGDWKLSAANAWIGDNAISLPTSGGNPQVSAFPHSVSNLVGVNQHSFTIPFSALSINLGTFCNADVIVAASAVVTRTVAGSGGGKSDKSGIPGKGGKSDKSSKGGKSDKNSKNSKAGKADKSVKSSTAKVSKAKSTKGSTNVASKGKSNKSGKSGKSGSSSPVTETFTVWAGNNIVGNGSYFSFKNAFCGPVTPPVIALPNPACFNVFTGTSSTGTSFSPVGITRTSQDSLSGWINTFPAAQGGFGAPFLKANGQSAGNLLAVLPGNGTMQVNITVPASLEVHSSNIYIGAAGSFANVSPLLYGTSSTKPNAASVLVNLPASLATNLDLVVYALLCPASTVD